MANKSVFASCAGQLLPRPDTENSEQAPAYALSPRQKLAQLAATGSVNRTFYAEAREQVAEVLPLVRDLDPSFVARVAVYARKRGYMKDMPALLVAALTLENPALAARVFSRVVDNGRMLRTFVQIMRSGVVGRKSLGSAPKRMVRNWLNNASDKQLVGAMVGQDPSLADVIKMVHPKPQSPEREALFAYLIGKPYDAALLPDQLKAFAAFKADRSKTVPDVPYHLLTALDLGPEHWRAIADRAPWHMMRMNLNTFARHGVLKDFGRVRMIAERLRDADTIRKVRVFPYQLLTAFLRADDAVPGLIRSALEDALEIATENVPTFNGRVVVAPDVSGSMAWPITGDRKGASSAVQCIDVAALIAATVVRKNPHTTVLPFTWDVHSVRINPRDSVMTNADILRKLPSGGTNISAPIKWLNERKQSADLVIIVSDNESWVDHTRSSDTGLMREWATFKARNPKAKLVAMDLVANTTTQAPTAPDRLNIGGFSDSVFDIIADFAATDSDTNHFVREIEAVTL